MDKRMRRPVSPLERRRWLEELESGTGVTQIAKRNRRDIRVVKRHLEIAEQERDLRGAHSAFIRSRLEQHQEKLLDETARLRSIVGSGQAEGVVPAGSMGRRFHEALMEHLRRSTLKRMLDRYREMADAYVEELGELQEQLRKRLEDSNRELPPLAVTTRWDAVVLSALRGCLYEDRPWSSEYERVPRREGFDFFRWGRETITQIPVEEETFRKIEGIHKALCELVEARLPKMRETVAGMKQLGPQIAEELEVLMVKAMVPGRCRYCPA